MIQYALLLFAAGYALFEGVREYLFYVINKKGGFPDIRSDKLRKVVNASHFFTVFLVAALATGLSDLQVAAFVVCAAAIRWVVHDGILYVLRKESFFYVGTVAAIEINTRRIAKWIGLPPELIIGIAKLTFIALFVTLYTLSITQSW